jgi:hypothetical protein
MMPERIQRKRTKGWKMPPNTVYVGRGSMWGNPYRVLNEEGFPIIEGPDGLVMAFNGGWELAQETVVAFYRDRFLPRYFTGASQQMTLSAETLEREKDKR